MSKLVVWCYNYKKTIFESKEKLIEHLLSQGSFEEIEYDLDDKYVAADDIGYPFEYWKKGTVFTLREWITEARKECPNLVKDKDDIYIISQIIDGGFWEKVDQ